MPDRKLDPVTAEAEADDADFAGEHDRPKADEREERDESTPSDRGGPGGGMDLPEHDG